MKYYLELENEVLVAIHSLKPDDIETVEYAGDIQIITELLNKKIPDELIKLNS